MEFSTAAPSALLSELPQLSLPALTNAMTLVELAALGRVSKGTARRVREEFARRDDASRSLHLWANDSYWDKTFSGIPGWRAEQWNALPPMEERRVDALCAMLGDGLYVCGGSRRGVATNAVERLRFSRWTWETLPPILGRRRVDFEAAAAVLNGQLYIIGGLDFSRLHASSCGDRFDPEHNHWETLPPMPARRRGAAATASSDCVLVCGGCSHGRASEEMHGSSGASNSVLSFRPKNFLWEEKPPMLERRFNAEAVVVNGSLYVGQRDAIVTAGLASVPFPLSLGERFNMVTERWSRCAPGLLCSVGSSVASVLHGCLYLQQSHLSACPSSPRGYSIMRVASSEPKGEEGENRGTALARSRVLRRNRTT